ncbi:MAG: lectin-like protein [Bacteroidota bacterium]
MRLLITLFAVAFSLTLVSAQSVWTGAVDSDWNNPANWAGGVPTSGTVATIPGSPQGGNFPVYTGDPVVDYTIQNLGTLTFDAYIYNNGTVINFSNGEIISNNYFINAGTVVFDNDGILTNNGTFDNYGTFDHAASAVLNIADAAVYNNFGTFRSNGVINNDGSFINEGNARTTQDFQNSGTLINRGNLESTTASHFSNNTGASFTNASGATFSVNGTFPNNGALENAGEFGVLSTAVLTNTTTINNTGEWQNAGQTVNDANFINDGTFVNNDVATLENNNNFQNNGTLDNSVCGIIIQNAGNTIGGTVINEGIVYEISGQVDVTESELGNEFNQLGQTKPPVPGCKPAVINLGCDGTVVVTPDDVDKGGYAQCGASLVSRTVSPNTFTLADVGDRFVTISFEDDNGNVSSCETFISIVAENNPLANLRFEEGSGQTTADESGNGNDGTLLGGTAWTTGQVGGAILLDGQNDRVSIATDPSQDASGQLAISAWVNPTSIDNGDGILVKGTAVSPYALRLNANGSLRFTANRNSPQGAVGSGNWSSNTTINTGEWTHVAVNYDGSTLQFYINGQLDSNQPTPNLTFGISNEPLIIGADLPDTDEYFNGAIDEVQLYCRTLSEEEIINQAIQNVDNPSLDISCPGDIAVTAAAGAANAIVDYSPPTATSNCTTGGGGLPACTDISESIAGFTYIGEFGNSKYYFSNQTNLTWAQAKTLTENSGGRLAIVDDAQENEYIRSNMASGTSVWIGLTDEVNEGTFVWVDGQVSTFFNWSPGEPNNSGGQENYVRLRQDNGGWTDRDANFQLAAVMEIECDNTPPCANAPNAVPGFTLIGEYNNSKYYRSNSTANWPAAQADCAANGGNLVTINDLDENEFVRSNLTIGTSSWIGLNDEANEGTYVWVNGEPFGYTNWSSNEPSRGSGEDYIRLRQDNGQWTDRTLAQSYHYVMEIPCQSNQNSCNSSPNSYAGFSLIGEFNGSKYFLSNTAELFTTAISLSSSNGGYLVAINSVEENNFISANITERVFIGLSDAQTEGAFAWVNGDPLTYTNWNAGEPNDFGSGEDGTEMLVGGLWNDIFEDANRRFIMEVPCGGGGPSGPPSIELISGIPPGGDFPTGDTRVTYKATDACGNAELCSFTVTVNETPANFQLTSCPADITVNAGPGALVAPVNWTEPSATTDCFRGPFGLTQTLGPDNGSDFPVGVTPVLYAVFDSCGNFESCGFNVTVAATPAVLTVNDCPSDINLVAVVGETSAIATWAAPTASSDCFTGSVNVNQIDGPTSGSAFPIGTTRIIYLVNDACGNTEVCFFDITVSAACPDADGDNVCDADDLCPGFDDAADADGDGIPDGCDDCDNTLEGTTCDDGDACTTNDIYDANCNCVGTFTDADSDGVCDADDVCPGFDDTADADGDGTPDGCDDCDNTLEGTACDDGDACTTNDVYDANCNCAGTFADADADGVCDADDVCPGFDDNLDGDNDGTPDGCDTCDGTLTGTSCDDGDACTTNDVYDADCNCAGTFADADADGVCDADDVCPGFDDNLDGDNDGTPDGCDTCDGTLTGTSCDDGDACTTNDVYDADCNCAGTFADADADGVCDADDACPGFDDNLDGDNDGTPDGCDTCDGTLTGTSCDDGDACTTNDVYDADCNCAGTFADADADGVCDADDVCPGFDDNLDGDNDGTPDGCDDCDAALIGTPCDDNDPNTTNDIFDDNCNCSGTPIGGGGCTATENLALTASASQSSEQGGAIADRAIDGNTSGFFYIDFSISQTNWEPQPWLELDLGSVANIEEIRIWNREDCCTDFLSNYYLLVSDAPFTSSSLNATLAQAGVAAYEESTVAGRPSSVSVDRTGRYVRIQLQGTAFLSIAELEVIGCTSGTGIPTCSDGIQNGNETGVDCGGPDCIPCCPAAGTACDDDNPNTANDVEDGNCNCAGTPIQTGECTSTTNLALNKPASQSGTQGQGSADKVVDGNTDGNFFSGFSINQTDWVPQAWWEVDLEEISNIEEIRIWNRADCCTAFLDNYYVLVSDVPFAAQDLATTLAQAGVSAYEQTTAAGRPTSVAVGRTGRYVRIQLQGTAFISMSEVEVIGCDTDGGTPTCTDGTQNGDETGIDCGGANCPSCCPVAGTPCDDNNPETVNDMEDGNCNCAGVPEGGSVDPPTGYCDAYGTQPWQQWIAYVGLGAIDNSSSKEGYGDFTDQRTTVVRGQSYDITLSPGFSYFHSEVYFRVWIDFNRDGDLEDAGEQVVETISVPGNPPFFPTPINSVLASINIPADAMNGATLMRVSMQKDRFADPCEIFDLGEVEDYVLMINGSGTLFSSSSEMLYFDARKVGREVELDWVTDTEYKNDFFIIEHSTNGIHFEPLMEVNSEKQGFRAVRYTQMDQRPAVGDNYYRVKQVALDGSHRYTERRKVHFELDLTAFSVFPNPATEEVFVNLKKYIGMPAQIQIYNGLGQLMDEKQFDQLETAITGFSVGDYQAGVYALTVQIEGRKRITRLFVVGRL